MMKRRSQQPASEAPAALTFAPLAFLKLQFFCHIGNTEIGGFGISSEDDPLYIEDFVTVRQKVSAVTVSFDDTAVADFFDHCVDQGISPSRCGRVWLHTHPGDSVVPSSTDNETFDRVFGRCDWSVMFILDRAGNIYARLSFSGGPGASLDLPVEVDWSVWPELLASRSGTLEAHVQEWREEYAANIETLPEPRFFTSAAYTFLFADYPWSGREAWDVGFDELSFSPIERTNHHEPF
jgi:hypothetical protein